jgi:hypothetical protein
MALTVTKMPVEKDEGKASQTARNECATMANDLASKLPKVELAILGAPAGATPVVTLDGQSIPTAALSVPRFVNPGKHVAVVTIPGGAEKTREFEIKEGESKTVEIALPAAKVEPSPSPSPSPSPGPNPNTTPPPAPTPTPTPTPTPAPMHRDERAGAGWLTYTGFGVAAVGLVIGTLTGLQAVSTSHKLDDACNPLCDPSESSRIRSYETQATISTVAFVVAGVGLTVGVIDLVTGATAPKQTSSGTLSIGVGPGSMGLVGSF